MFREVLHEQEPTVDDKVCSAMLDNWKITIGGLSDGLGLSLFQYSPFGQNIWA